MSFDRRDLDNDDDEFNFDDEFGDTGDAGDEFQFEEEPEFGLEEEGRFGFEEEDMPEIEEEEGEGGGVSRTFVIIAALMIILFILGLGAVLLISTQQPPVTPFDMTASAIVAINATTQANAFETATQNAIDAATNTVLSLTPLASPTLPPTETPFIPTVTPTPTLDETAQAAAAIQTQQALELTQTAEFLLTPPTPTQGVGAQDVALTATALAQLLQPPTPGGPTQEVFLTPGTVVAGIPTALPETGFFEDLAAGNANVGMIALMALGLAAVIVMSRRLRTENK